ncbi:MAG: insulinase family protein [Bacteroidota bacterium]
MNTKYPIHILAAFLLLVTACTPKTGKLGQKTPSPKGNTTASDFRSQAPAPGPAPVIQIGRSEQFEMDNGLRVIVVENHKIPRVSLRLFIDLPTISEGEYAGYLDIAGNLLSKGTSNRSKAEIDEAIDFMGASLSTSASGVSGASLTKHFPDLMAIASEVLLAPTFPEAEFEKIKTQTLSGLAQAKEDPNTIASNVAQVLRYGKDHPYGEIVTESSIEKVTVDKCREFYDRYFQPGMAYLVIVGDIDLATAKQLANKNFGSWQTTGEVMKKEYAQPAAPASTKVDFVNKTGAVQSVIAITYPVEMRPGHPDRIKARVMNTMLGSFFQSRLNLNLRETHGYTYGARSSLASDREIGYFSAGASVRNEVTDSALVQFLYELNRIRDELLTPEELELARNVIAGNFARSLERPQTIANFALNTVRYNLPSDYYATYLEKLSQVTAADVRAMAQKYVRPDRAHILVVGNSDEVSEKLTPFSPSGLIDYYDAYGNRIELSDLEVPAGYTAEKVIDRYLQVLGGREAIAKIKTLSMEMSTEMQGMKITMESAQEVAAKYATFVSMNGSVIQSEVYDGQRAKRDGMMGSEMVEEEALGELKENLYPVRELAWQDLGYSLKLEGIEVIEGEKTYRMSVVTPSGKKSTSYYSIDTGLRVRSIVTGEQGGQSFTQTLDFSDYREVNGVKFPYRTKITGGSPVPMTMEVKEIGLNQDLDPELFEIE